MKIKLTPVYILAFFTLVFLIHEIHDWIHVLVARAVAECWGTKGFDLWTICTKNAVSTKGMVLITISGPLFNYLVMCWGWELMQPENEIQQKSLGFSLVFASLPFPRILTALVGGGDETKTLRMLFQRVDGSNHLYVSLAGLLLILLLTLPAIYRAIMLVAGWWGKIGVIGFLVVPGFIDHWLVGGVLSHLLADGFLARLVWTGFSQAIMAWLLLLVVLLLAFGHRLLSLFEYKELDL